MNIRKMVRTATLASGFLAISAFLMLSTAMQATGGGTKAGKDIVDTAVGAGSFKTLVTAVKAADLVDTLKGEGPFIMPRL